MKTSWLPFLIILVVIGGALFVVRMIYVADKSERDLHALICTIDVVEAYVNEYGRWPDSWDDLENVKGSKRSSIYEWPRHRTEIERRIDVDFGLDLDDIDFTVDSLEFPIRCRDVYYIEHDHRFQFLIEAVEKHRQK
ncbi:MAG: hypothetical protein WEB58_17190 [Planctomycetaceae bacterium]